jgi:hypothetical protein
MKTVLLLLLVTAPLAAQTYEGVEEVPVGTNWIADRNSKQYYPVDCALAAQVPKQDRLYFATESAVRLRGFARNAECPGALRLEDEPAPVTPPGTDTCAEDSGSAAAWATVASAVRIAAAGKGA